METGLEFPSEGYFPSNMTYESPPHIHDTPNLNFGGQGTPNLNFGGQGAVNLDLGGQGTPNFNFGGQGAVNLDLGGQGTPNFNFGGQGAVNLDLGGQGAVNLDLGGQGTPNFNFGGQGAPNLNFGGQGAPNLDFEGHGAPNLNFGQGTPNLNFGGQGAPNLDFGGHGAPNLDFGGQGAANLDLGGQGVPNLGFERNTNFEVPSLFWNYNGVEPLFVKPPTFSMDDNFKQNTKKQKTPRQKQIRRDYLGCPQPLQVMNFQFEKNLIKLSHESRITTNHGEIVSWILSQLPPDDKERFQQFAGILFYLILAEDDYHIDDRLYSTVFNPATNISDKTLQEFLKQPEAVWKRVERKFLDRFIHILIKSNFKSLSQEELDFASNPQSKDSFFFQITEDWDQLDPNLMNTFFEQLKPQNTTEKPPPYASYCLVFWRGIGVKPNTDYFFAQKLYSIFSRISQKLVFFQPEIKSRNIPEIPKIPKNKSETSIHEERVIKRKVLSPEDCSLKNFFVKKTIQEPTFEEIILLYRKKPLDKKGNKTDTNLGNYNQNPHAIHIQRFYNIPMNHLKVIFPTKKKSTNWADYFYYGLILSWILTTLFKLQSAWAKSTYLDELLLAVLCVFLPFLLKYLTSLILSHRASRYMTQTSQDTLQNNSLNCSKSVMSYLHTTAHSQTFRILVLAYYLLREWGGEGATLEELDTTCEHVLKEVFGEVVDFPVEEVRELIRLGIVREEGGKYVAVGLEESKEKLHEQLGNILCSVFEN